MNYGNVGSWLGLPFLTKYICKIEFQSSEKDILSLPAMGHKKLIRFEEIKTFPNVLQYPTDMPGNWSKFFGNANPLVLELACGKWEYEVGLGSLYPGKNFIGVDLKGNRIWVGAKKALSENLKNVAFLRSQIDKVDSYFAAGEVESIWITFPDPQLRLSKAKKRLTHPRFLRLYQRFLKPGGTIHLKTDSPNLYAFTRTVIDINNLELLESSDDVYAGETISRELQIKTYYEGLDIAGSKKVHYLCFRIDSNLDHSNDALLKQKISEIEID